MFSEILVYEDALDELGRKSLESYLMGKWIPGHKGFSVDKNGTLRTTSLFDYETDDRNQTITIWATDQLGASFDKNFTVTITNIVEDMDGDGTEDHYDNDIDGDGLPIRRTCLRKIPEMLIPNVLSDINANNLTFFENSPDLSLESLQPQIPRGIQIYLHVPTPIVVGCSDLSSVIHNDGNLTRWKNKASASTMHFLPVVM